MAQGSMDIAKRSCSVFDRADSAEAWALAIRFACCKAASACAIWKAASCASCAWFKSPGGRPCTMARCRDSANSCWRLSMELADRRGETDTREGAEDDKTEGMADDEDDEVEDDRRVEDECEAAA